MDTKALREEFTRLQTEALALVDLASKESRDFTDEENAQQDAREKRMNQIKTLLEQRAKFASLAIGVADPEPTDEPAEPKGTVEKPKDAPGADEFSQSLDIGEKPNIKVGETKIDPREFSSALSRWALTGEMDRKFATITTATQSGALLPKQIALPIVPTTANAFREALAVTGASPIVSNTTAEMTIPVMDASAGAEVNEDASSETENAPSLAGTITLNFKTYQSGTAWFSNRVLAANNFDLIPYVNTDLVYAKELGFEAAIAAAIIADVDITQTVTTSGVDALTYSNLGQLNRALPKKYDRNKAIVLSEEAYGAAERLVGSDGHPILLRDPQNQELLRFNGTPVLRCDELEDFGAGNVVGVVLSTMGFKIRDFNQLMLTRYTQNPAKPDQIGLNLVGYHRHGYTPTAMAKLVCPTS